MYLNPQPIFIWKICNKQFRYVKNFHLKHLTLFACCDIYKVASLREL